jgi:hypothetical protein
MSQRRYRFTYSGTIAIDDFALEKAARVDLQQTVVELRAELAPGYFSPSAAAHGDREDKDGAAPISPAQLVELVKMLASTGTSN